MKKAIFTSLISASLLFASCDYVSNPYPEKNANISDTATCLSVTFPVVTSHIKKLLIEDYTGHTCPNCPRAARNIDTLENQHPGQQVIVLAIHAGSLAAPTPGFGGSSTNDFIEDYRTTVGNTYDAFFKCSTSGLPSLLENRKDYNSVDLTHLKSYISIPSDVAPYLTEPSVVDLQIKLNYDTTNRKLCCAIRDSFLTTVTGNYKLVSLLAQDSLISFQDDIDHGLVSNYIFNHVLRDAINPTGAWGETLVTGGAVSGLTQIRHFAYTLPNSFNNITCIPKNCKIVAFIYNTATWEIIQAEEAIIP
ncbi:MAG: Omp28-related outer membrane protein [Bacteroidota bacterium]